MTPMRAALRPAALAAAALALLAPQSATAICGGSSYSYGSAACASCAAGATFVSASAGCRPSAALSAGPTDTAFSLSGSQAEGIAAFALTGAAPTFVTDHLGNAAGALALASGTYLTASGANAPGALPTGNASWTASAWVKCAAPATWAAVFDWGAIGGAQSILAPQTIALSVIGSGLALPNSGSVSTLAGGNNSSSFVDGVGTSASFSNPIGVAAFPNGVMAVLDQASHRIRLVSLTGAVTVFAGSGLAGYADGAGTAASFRWPDGLAIDPSTGTIIVADTQNNCVRLVSPAGMVSTLAGNCGLGPGFVDGMGAVARFYWPVAVAVVPLSSVAVVSDYLNHCVRLITPLGAVTTLAGTGTSGFANGVGSAAAFSYPRGVAVTQQANVVVADTFNNRIRLVTPLGLVTTLAGNGSAAFADGVSTAACLNFPTGVSVAPSGADFIIVADTNNNRLRLVSQGGLVTTLAGQGIAAYADGTGTNARFNNPNGVAVIPSSGYIVVADGGNIRVRLVQIPFFSACDSAWHVIALIYAPSATPYTLSAFLDGAVVINSTLTITLPAASASTLRVGWSGDLTSNSGSLFSGSISDLRIFNRTLSIDEVAALSRPPSPSATPSTTPSPSSTLTQTPSTSASPSRTPSPTPTGSLTLTSTTSLSATLSMTSSLSQSASPTPSPTATPTTTQTPSTTASPSRTPSPTPTGSLTLTSTTSLSATLSMTSSLSQSASPTPSPTATPTTTSTASSSYVPSLTSSQTGTPSPTPSGTPTSTVSATASPLPAPAAGAVIFDVILPGGSPLQFVSTPLLGVQLRAACAALLSVANASAAISILTLMSDSAGDFISGNSAMNARRVLRLGRDLQAASVTVTLTIDTTNAAVASVFGASPSNVAVALRLAFADARLVGTAFASFAAAWASASGRSAAAVLAGLALGSLRLPSTLSAPAPVAALGAFSSFSTSAAIGGGAAAAVLVLVFAVALRSRRRRAHPFSTKEALPANTAASSVVVINPAHASSGLEIRVPASQYPQYLPTLIWEHIVPDIVVNPITTGAFGIVFKARYNDSPVAVKLLKKSGDVTDAAFARVTAELMNEGALKGRAIKDHMNENVITFYGMATGAATQQWRGALSKFGFGPSVLFSPADKAANANGSHITGIVMGWKNGGDLAVRLYGSPMLKIFTPVERLRIASEIASGLHGLHRSSIVHADLKPANVLLSSADGPAALAAFGFANTLPSDSTMTGRERAADTWRYMAPELFRFNPKASSARRPKREEPSRPHSASDVYAFGVLAWELLSWKQPWQGVAGTKHAENLYNDEKLDLESLPSSLPPVVRKLIERCLDFDPGARPSMWDVDIELRQEYTKLTNGKFDVFLSYAWGADDWRRHFALEVHNGLVKNGLKVWLDNLPEGGGQMGLFLKKCMSKGIEASSVAVILFSPDYANSASCKYEIDDIVAAGLPKIVVFVEPGSWKSWMKMRDVVYGDKDERSVPDDHHMAVQLNLHSDFSSVSLGHLAVLDWKLPDNGMVISDEFRANRVKLYEDPDAVPRLVSLIKQKHANYRYRYDVVLSYARGPRWRPFVHAVLQGLIENGYKVFFDDDTDFGGQIGLNTREQRMREGIRASCVAVILFSSDYAGCKSCSFEFDEIIDDGLPRVVATVEQGFWKSWMKPDIFGDKDFPGERSVPDNHHMAVKLELKDKQFVNLGDAARGWIPPQKNTIDTACSDKLYKHPDRMPQLVRLIDEAKVSGEARQRAARKSGVGGARA